MFVCAVKVFQENSSDKHKLLFLALFFEKRPGGGQKLPEISILMKNIPFSCLIYSDCSPWSRILTMLLVGAYSRKNPFWKVFNYAGSKNWKLLLNLLMLPKYPHFLFLFKQNHLSGSIACILAIGSKVYLSFWSLFFFLSFSPSSLSYFFELNPICPSIVINILHSFKHIVIQETHSISVKMNNNVYLLLKLMNSLSNSGQRVTFCTNHSTRHAHSSSSFCMSSSYRRFICMHACMTLHAYLYSLHPMSVDNCIFVNIHIEREKEMESMTVIQITTISESHFAWRICLSHSLFLSPCTSPSTTRS